MRTRIIVLLLAVVLATCLSQAQFKIGARAGFSLTNVNFNFPSGDEELDNSINPKMKPGFQIGVVGGFELNNAFSVQSGILFATQGWKIDSDYEAREEGIYTKIQSKGKTNLNYIQVPILAIYKLDLSGAKLLLQIGPYFGYGLGGQSKSESSILMKFNDEVIIDEKTSLDNKIKMGSGEDQVNAFDFGLNFGTGVQFGNIQTTLSYSIGLVNLYNKSTLDMMDEDISMKNKGFSLTITYLFGN
ncbi:MAG: PorT family protein [Marinilabiliaceae bacterium]|nr:PorT family protein [Marinilabiliaceae bacterium]